jgi:hypothetical protein
MLATNLGKLGAARVMPCTSTYVQDVMYRALARKEATLPVKELDCTVTTLKPCANTAPPMAVEKQENIAGGEQVGKKERASRRSGREI